MSVIGIKVGIRPQSRSLADFPGAEGTGREAEDPLGVT
jgi:hypothetical protein